MENEIHSSAINELILLFRDAVDGLRLQLKSERKGNQELRQREGELNHVVKDLKECIKDLDMEFSDQKAKTYEVKDLLDAARKDLTEARIELNKHRASSQEHWMQKVEVNAELHHTLERLDATREDLAEAKTSLNIATKTVLEQKERVRAQAQIIVDLQKKLEASNNCLNNSTF